MTTLVQIGFAFLIVYRLMIDHPGWWWLALIFPVSLPLAVGLVKLHRNHRFSTNPQFTEVDFNDPRIPREIATRFIEVDEELEKAGFDLVDTLVTTSMVAGSTGYLTLFCNEALREAVKFVAADVRAQHLHKTTVTIAIFSEFTDGTEVVTTNNRAPWIFPLSQPPHHVFPFPQVEDASRLLEIHRALVRRFDAGRTRHDPIGQDLLEFTRRHERRFRDNMLAWGYSWVDPTEPVQRLTWKGAALITWRLMPPCKQIREARRLRLAQRTLRELHDEGYLARKSKMECQ